MIEFLRLFFIDYRQFSKISGITGMTKKIPVARD